MPGPVSDSYDPEWGVGNGDRIRAALAEMHAKLGVALGSPPMNILDVLDMPDGAPRPVYFTERDLRLLRFSTELAAEDV